MMVKGYKGVNHDTENREGGFQEMKNDNISLEGGQQMKEW